MGTQQESTPPTSAWNLFWLGLVVLAVVVTHYQRVNGNVFARPPVNRPEPPPGMYYIEPEEYASRYYGDPYGAEGSTLVGGAWESPGKGILGDLPPEIQRRAWAGDGDAVREYDAMRLEHFMTGEQLKNRRPLPDPRQPQNPGR